MAKKAVKSGTQGRKNKGLNKIHIDLTGSNKVPIFEKSPFSKSIYVKVLVQ